MPCLIYAIEAVPFNKSFLRALEHPWTRVFNKIFTTFDADTILGCQCFSGYLPLEHVAQTRKVKFLSDMMSSSCYYIRAVVSLTGNEELNAIAEFYAVDVPCLIKNCHEIAFKSVETQVGL